jgi:heat-inducible transcriptional repressor
MLTDRQKQILQAIVKEYTETGTPVGSAILDKKYSLGVSPATIRNEMVKLSNEGYLDKPHSSAGRVPTAMAFRLYIKELMKEKELSVAEEVAVKERAWHHRFEPDKLLKETTKVLAEKTKALAVAATKEGNIYHSGYANILDIPEFYDIDVTKTVLSLLDEINEIQKLFTKSFDDEPVHVLIGDEIGVEMLSPCSLVFADFEAGPKLKGSLGVIGPCRFDFSYIIPVVRYFAALLEEVGRA